MNYNGVNLRVQEMQTIQFLPTLKINGNIQNLLGIKYLQQLYKAFRKYLHFEVMWLWTNVSDCIPQSLNLRKCFRQICLDVVTNLDMAFGTWRPWFFSEPNLLPKGIPITRQLMLLKKPTCTELRSCSNICLKGVGYNLFCPGVVATYSWG